MDKCGSHDIKLAFLIINNLNNISNYNQKINRILIITFLFNLSGLISSQNSVGFSFVSDIQSTNINALRIDKHGDLIMAGSFNGIIDVNLGNGVTNISSNGNNDILICKYDNNLNLIWAKQIGDIGNEGVIALSIDSLDNIILIGTYNSPTIDFDPGIGVYNLSYTTQTSFSANFVLKLTSSGNFVWAKSFQPGNTGYFALTSVATDSNNNIYSTGSFKGVIDFDPNSSIQTFTSVGNYDAFLFMLNANGNFGMVNQIGNTGVNCQGGNIQIGKMGNIYWTGVFSSGSVDFDPGIGITILSSTSNSSFVSKFNNNNAFVWAKKYDSNLMIGKDIVIDMSENIFFANTFNNTIDFDPGTTIYNLSSFGGGDIYVTKLNSAGNFVWAKQMGSSSPSPESANHIAIDKQGNIYTTGLFSSIASSNTSGSADFDPGPSNYFLNTFTSLNSDIFICKLDNNGNFIWAKALGGIANDEGRLIAVDSSMNVYSSGIYYSTCDFDPGIGISNLSSISGSCYVHKLSPCNPLTPPTLNTTLACEGSSSTITASSSGTVTWYNSPIVNNSFNSGNNYITPPLNLGTYTFYAASNNTCSPSSITSIVVNIFQPTVNVAISSSTICEGETTTMTANGYNNYTWTYTNILIGPTVSFQPSTSINITLTANSNTNICSAVHVIPITVNKCLSVYKLSNTQFEPNIYPNPVEDILFFDVEQLFDKFRTFELEITNVLGELIFKKEITSKLTEISPIEWPKGFYILKFSAGEKEWLKKILLE